MSNGTIIILSAVALAACLIAMKWNNGRIEREKLLIGEEEQQRQYREAKAVIKRSLLVSLVCSAIVGIVIIVGLALLRTI